MHRLLKHGLLALGLCLAAGLGPVRAQDTSEVALKAVLFHKLAQFVYLPAADRTRKTQFCVLNQDSLATALERLTQAEGGPRPLRPRSAAAARGCDLLFIGRAEAEDLLPILQTLADSPVLTVSDIDGFARAGGLVEFAPRGDRSGTQILLNRRLANQRGIDFNAQLLRLARIVEP